MRGGRREGAGRKAGVKSTKNVDRMKKVEQVMAAVNEAVPNAFEGDAHAFLIAVYKNPEMTLKDRIACAVAAAPFEKPKLNSVDVTADVEARVEVSRIELVAPSIASDDHPTYRAPA